MFISVNTMLNMMSDFFCAHEGHALALLAHYCHSAIYPPNPKQHSMRGDYAHHATTLLLLTILFRLLLTRVALGFITHP